MAVIVNLPINLLRAFITVVDLGSYSKAAELLCRTQPAISLQIRKLEELVDAKLIENVNRKLKPTEEGGMLSGYARKILSLNDEAVFRYRKKPSTGSLRIGLPTDYAVAYFQKLMMEFKKNHPDVDIQICCDLSIHLLEELRQDKLDIVIAMTSKNSTEYLAHSWISRPIWVCGSEFKQDENEPLPLVVHPEGCEYRNRIIEWLNKNRIQWRIVYCSPGISSLQTAVSAGFGISALTHPTVTEEMKVLTEVDGFPPLSDLHVGLYYKHPRIGEAGHLLVNHTLSRLIDLDEPDFFHLD